MFGRLAQTLPHAPRKWMLNKRVGGVAKPCPRFVEASRGFWISHIHYNWAEASCRCHETDWTILDGHNFPRTCILRYRKTSKLLRASQNHIGMSFLTGLWLVCLQMPSILNSRGCTSHSSDTASLAIFLDLTQNHCTG